MKLPRNVSPVRVIALLQSLHYRLAPQRGNHICLRRPSKPLHVITFLNQDPLEARTLRGIIAEVSYEAFVPVAALIGRL